MTTKRNVRVSVEGAMRWDAAVHKAVHESLPYYAPGFLNAVFDGSGVSISFDGDAYTDEEIVANISSLIRRTASGFRDTQEQLLFSGTASPRLTKDDPYEQLCASGAVTPTGYGKFVFAKEFVTLFEAVDAKLKDYCLSVGAFTELYPTTVEAGSLLASGFLGHSPHLAYFAAPARLDHKLLPAFGDTDAWAQADGSHLVESLGSPDHVLAPTVCYHCFEARKGRQIGTERITALNKCHRHEAVGVSGLERTTTFWMRELIAFDTQDRVTEMLEDAVNWTASLLNEWGAAFDVSSASDPFFADLGASNRIFQTVFALKRELRMPVFSGRRIAVASFNNHQQSLVQKFDVKGAEQPNTPSSGCVGWGFERLLYSLFCQFGVDLSLWPSPAKRSLNI